MCTTCCLVPRPRCLASVNHLRVKWTEGKSSVGREYVHTVYRVIWMNCSKISFCVVIMLPRPAINFTLTKFLFHVKYIAENSGTMRSKNAHALQFPKCKSARKLVNKPWLGWALYRQRANRSSDWGELAQFIPCDAVVIVTFYIVKLFSCCE